MTVNTFTLLNKRLHNCKNIKTPTEPRFWKAFHTNPSTNAHSTCSVSCVETRRSWPDNLNYICLIYWCLVWEGYDTFNLTNTGKSFEMSVPQCTLIRGCALWVCVVQESHSFIVFAVLLEVHFGRSTSAAKEWHDFADFWSVPVLDGWPITCPLTISTHCRLKMIKQSIFQNWSLL